MKTPADQLQGLRPGTNPRDVLGKHRERGPKKFEFTYADAAAALQMSPASVRADYHLRKILRERDLLELARAIVKRRGP